MLYSDWIYNLLFVVGWLLALKNLIPLHQTPASKPETPQRRIINLNDPSKLPVSQLRIPQHMYTYERCYTN